MPTEMIKKINRLKQYAGCKKENVFSQGLEFYPTKLIPPNVWTQILDDEVYFSVYVKAVH